MNGFGGASPDWEIVDACVFNDKCDRIGPQWVAGQRPFVLSTSETIMRLNRMQQFGSLALLCGLALLGNTPFAPASVSREEMAGKFGGACVTCTYTLPCNNVDAACAAAGNLFSKTTWRTTQTEASCSAPQETGFKNCGTPNMPLECSRTTTCTDAACTLGCNSGTTTVPSNCPMSGGNCVGS